MKLSPDSLEYLTALMKSEAAIELLPAQRYLAEARLEALARANRLLSPDDVVREARRDRSGALAQQIVESLTINETQFFRDVRVFDTLRRQVLPSLAKARLPGQTINIWSAACSTGQEPFSVALLLVEHFPELLPHCRIIASDICSSALQRARSGRYSQIEVNRGLPRPFLNRYFEKEGLEWVLRFSVRKLVEFQRINLATEWTPLPKVHLLLLRNVLIYLEEAVKHKLLERLRGVLAPGARLVLGSAETVISESTFQVDRSNPSGCFRQIREPSP